MTEAKSQIRQARADDLPHLIDIIRRTIESYGYIFELEFELPDFLKFDEYYGAKAELYVIESDGKVIGCGALKGIGAEPFLSRIYVDEAWRGRGFGKAIVLFLMKRCVELGHQQLELWSDTLFRTAHKLYEGLGFKFSGRVRPLGDVNNCFEYHYVMEPSGNPFLTTAYLANIEES